MNSEKKVFLYVMSGTGNTFRMAHWLKDYLQQKNRQADLSMIDEAKPANMPEFAPGHLVGVLFPAHGLMAPWSMIKFLFRIPRGSGATAFSGATRGGVPIGKWILPGAVGLGNFMAAFILLIKGYRVRAMFSLDMPVNFINLFWGLDSKNIEMVSQKAKKKLEAIASKILDGKAIIFTKNNLWEALWAFPLLWLVPVYPIIYILIGRIFMGKMLFSSNQCASCGLCAKFCPNNAIIMKPSKNKKKPFWTFHCEACMRCMGFCKKRAVEAGHSWGVLLYFITAVPVITWLIKWTSNSVLDLPVMQNYWTGQLINFLYIFPAMMVAYYLFWHLIRIPFFDTIFTYSTLTHYFRRYHEPGTRLRDLKNIKNRGL